jgi:hypothetical protein
MAGLQSASAVDSEALRIVLLVEYANGAYREYTAEKPLDFHLGVGRTYEGAEPRIVAAFAGNPAEGGITVSAAGVA